MSFKPHGYYKLWRKGSILYAELSGSWNVEAAQEFEREFMELAKKMPDCWGHLVLLDEWELCTPDTTSVVERLVDWCIDNGLKRAANVYRPSALKNNILNKMIVLEQSGFKRAVFDNQEDAVSWLCKEGYPA